MITDNQITALAREYAEEQGKFDREQGFSESFIKDMLEFNEKDMKSALDFLLRRYCLVEKRKVKDEYDEARIFCENVDPYGESYARNEARMFLLERLFPEIGKEVEG